MNPDVQNSKIENDISHWIDVLRGALSYTPISVYLRLILTASLRSSLFSSSVTSRDAICWLLYQSFDSDHDVSCGRL